MILVAKVKLTATPEQREALLATMRRINEACNWLAERAFEIRCADKIKLQRIAYGECRARFGLSAQMTIRAIAKVCEVYKRDKSVLPRFQPWRFEGFYLRGHIRLVEHENNPKRARQRFQAAVKASGAPASE